MLELLLGEILKTHLPFALRYRGALWYMNNQRVSLGVLRYLSTNGGK